MFIAKGHRLAGVLSGQINICICRQIFKPHKPMVAKIPAIQCLVIDYTPGTICNSLQAQ